MRKTRPFGRVLPRDSFMVAAMSFYAARIVDDSTTNRGAKF